MLADSLRTSRVTLLYGQGNASRTDLLTEGVLPLLQRRAADGSRRSGRGAKGVAPNVERRVVDGPRRRRAERVVLFGDWAGAPLAGLEVAILSSLPMGVVMQAQNLSLPDLLAELSERLDAQFLILFDAFESLWGADSRADAVDQFVDQLSEALNRKSLNANFLLSIDEAAGSRLDSLRHRFAGFDDSTLRLHPDAPLQVQREPVSPAPRSADPEVPRVPMVTLVEQSTFPVVGRPERSRRKRPPRQPLPVSVPIKAEGVYAFIESTLTQTADVSEPWHAARGSPTEVEPPPLRERPLRRPDASKDKQARPRTDVSSMDDPNPRTPLPSEPPSPIDQWLDLAASWCRRLFRPR